MSLLASCRQPSTWVPLLVFATLAAVPIVATAFDQSYYVALVGRMVIYAIAATALNLALGYGGMVSFGHALFLGIGCYAVALPAFHSFGSGWVHLALTLVLCAVVGAIIGIVSLRTSGIAFIMITLAFGQMGYFLLVSLKQYGGDDGLPVALTSRFGPIDLGKPVTVYVVALAVLALSVCWLAYLRASPFGMALRGARQNPRRVQALGLPVLRYQLTAFVLSSMLCGVAGLLLANLNAFASPSTLAWIVSGELIVMVVIGGMGTVFGPVLGAIAFFGLEELLKNVTEHWMIIFGPLILLVALMRNKGLVGLLQALDRDRKETGRPADSRAPLHGGIPLRPAPIAKGETE